MILMAELHSAFKQTGAIIHKDAALLGNNDATPSVAGGNVFKTATGNTGALDLTMFDGGTNGQIITVIASNPTNKTTVKDAGNMLINGDWLEAADKTLTLVFDGTNWYEIARV